MTITVTAPNGSTVDFPDGTDEATISNAMNQVMGVTPQEMSIPETIDSAVRKVAQGATFGYADEISAGLNSIFNGKTYTENVAQERERDDSIGKRMPVTSTVAQIIGAVASPLNKVIGAGVNAIRTPGYVNYALQGGVGGGIVGSGESTEGNRLSGASSGFGWGAVFGAGIPALLEGGRRAVGAVADRFSAPSTAAARRLEAALARDGMSVDDAARAMSELGPESTLADVGSNVRGLAEASATRPGRSLTAAENLAAGRASGRSDRLVQAALDSVGTDSLETLIKQRSVAARPLYQVAFSQDNYRTIRSPLVERLMTRPDFQKGLRAGIKDVLDEAAITGDDIRAFNTFFDGANLDDPTLILKKEPTLRILDAAKRGFDKILNSDELINANGTKKQEWFRMNDMRQSLVKEIDDKLAGTKWGDAYKAARETWAGPSDAINALAHVEKVAANARDGSDITGRLFGSKTARDKLKGLFKDQDSYNRFSKVVSGERRMADTERRLTGNSRTSYRVAAQADMDSGGFVDTAFDVANNPSLSNIVGKGLSATRNWLRAPPTNISDELTGLYVQGQSRDQLLNAVQDRISGGNLLSRALRPYAGGNLLSARVGGYSGGLLGSNQ